MWKKLFSGTNDEQDTGEDGYIDLDDLIRDFAPAAIRSDRDLMLEACMTIPAVLEYVDASLSTDHDFLLEALGCGCGYFLLFHIPDDVQCDFPDVVASDTSDFVENGVAAAFWEDRDLFYVGSVMVYPFWMTGMARTSGKKNEGIFIRIAQHCFAELRQASFEKASMSLRGNKAFMLRVLNLEPSLLEFVAPVLRNDFDLCLVAFSGKESVVQNEVSRCQDQNDKFDFIWISRSQVLELLNKHSTFTSTVLPAMSQQTNSGCSLTTLDQGSETSYRYKKKIARYIGVPTGKHLRLLRQALRNLNEALGIHPQP